MHALIIEDDWLIALQLEEILRREGFRSCAVADTEAAAITAAEERCPDVVTADVRLRRGTGTAAVRAICARRPVPVVYVTANPHEVADAPGTVVVAKPFAEPTLERALRDARAKVAAAATSAA